MTEKLFMMNESQRDQILAHLGFRYDNDSQNLEEMVLALPTAIKPLVWARPDISSMVNHQMAVVNASNGDGFTIPLYTSPQALTPITADALDELHHIEEFGLFCSSEEFEQIARAIEHEHGIHAPKQEQMSLEASA